MNWLPPNASSYGAEVDRLFWIIAAITGFFFFLVQGALLLFVLIYRAKPGKQAQYLHGNTLLEVIWTAIPAVILIWLTFASQKVWAEIRYPKNMPAAAVNAQLLAEQFAWNVRYPGPDGLYETPDDITTINQLHLPVGMPVRLQIKSKDVIHSFFVAELRVKQDAVPGMSNTVWIEATRAGEFEIRCAELCGLGHYRMKGFVKTESPLEFDAWLKETKANE